MGRPAGWMKKLTGRGAMRSPGAPSHRNEIERRFWKEVATGITSEKAAEAVGVSQAVGSRWFRHRGGMPLFMSKPLSERYLSFAEREEIGLLRAQDVGVREIARLIGRHRETGSVTTLLRALAQTAGQMCNYTRLGGQVGLDGKTASRYIGVFEQMYLLRRIDVWARNRLNRVVKTPKLQFIDSGLLATLLGLSADEVQQDRTRFGNVLETFVFGELLKHTTTSDGDYRLMYYRDADKFEVDVVIENAAGQLVGVEVKAAATVKERDLRGLRKLSSLAGDQFKMGVLLYDGDETMPLGDGIWAAPLASLSGQ